MNPCRALLFAFALLTGIATNATPTEGFFLPDSVNEITFRYKNIDNLIVLPVRINDSEVVSLVLDTGCRNLVLFGKRFRKMLAGTDPRTITFSGLGRGKPVTGFITLENDVEFSAVTGKRIAIVVVPERNVFQNNPQIDGVIGYELFLKFEIEINFGQQLITFRPAKYSYPDSDFQLVPLRVEDSRPIIPCTIQFSKNESEACDLLIDTGSCLGLLYISPADKNQSPSTKTVVGRGINGEIEGRKGIATKLRLGNYEIEDVPAAIVASPTRHYASLGTGVLKDYTLLLNYQKAYAGFKQN